jgi:hypothetical protein
MKPIWREMTALERRAIEAIRYPRVSYIPGINDKRFARHLNAQLESGRISERQAIRLWTHVWKYRRQIHAADLITEAQRRSVPATDGAFLQ